MLVKQKRSAARVAAVHVVLFGVVILSLIASQWLPGQLNRFSEPVTRTSPIVFAQADTRIEDQFNSRQQFEEDLQQLVDDFASSQSGEYSVYIEHLPTEISASHRETETMKAASLYKLFVANEALKMVDDNKLVLEAVIDGERGHTLAKCLEIMITISDNSCGEILQRTIGATNALLPSLKVQGFDGTDLRGVYPRTTAKDVARAFRNLEEQTYLSETSNDLLMSFLGNQRIHDRLPAGLPEGTSIDHKTGDIGGFVHDSGIVRSEGGDYIIVVMSEPDAESSPRHRYGIIADFSRKVHDLVQEQAD